MIVVDDAYNHKLAPEEHASALLAGGIAGMGYQCGQVWGAALAAGARAYQVFGPGPAAEMAAVRAAQRLAESFQARYKSYNCSDVTQMDFRSPQGAQVLGYLLKGGPARCFGMTANYARLVFDEINGAYAGQTSGCSDGAAASPVSCAAVVAQRMGATEQQQVMAAGFAGGIGLSGGACGALGAAVWMHAFASGGQAMGLMNSEVISGLTERFLESTGYEFECEKIIGRRFADYDDHARYVQDGGCAKIIEALSGTAKVCC